MAASSKEQAHGDLTVSQRMLSAVTGSFFTSILVTPLDVVRVRLQSQSSPGASAFAQIQQLATKRGEWRNVPNLGVAACCRKVFWVNNNAQLCIAGTGPPESALATSSRFISSQPLSASAMTATDCAVQEAQRRTFTSTFDALHKIARNEGFFSLWRGLSPTLVMGLPANVIYFTGYDALRYSSWSPLRGRISDQYAPLLAGSLARIAAATAISPIELFRTRLQAVAGKSRGSGPSDGSAFRATLTGLRDIVQSQGWTSLWRGLTLTLWRDVPFSGIYWWGYETGRDYLRDLRISRESSSSLGISSDNHSTTFLDSFVAGATSGAIASIVTSPFDVGKTRQQVFLHASDVSAPSTGNAKASGVFKGSAAATHAELRPEERSMPRLLLHIFRTEGLPGLFRGWVARTLKVAPACAIMISTYEMGKRMARRANEQARAQAVS